MVAARARPLLSIYDAAGIAFSGETALAVDLGNGDRAGAKRGSVEGSASLVVRVGRARRTFDGRDEVVGCTNPVSCREAVFVDKSAQAISTHDVGWSGRAGES